MQSKRYNKAGKVVWLGFFANLMLTLFKLSAGIFGRSAAMLADAVHSVSDNITDLVIAGSLKIASRPSDGNHKYGHGKVETLAAAFVGTVLFAVGIGILYAGATKIISHITVAPLQRPKMIAFWAAVTSIVIKELLYRYTRFWGRKLNSNVLTANAWHHRSDVYSSIGTLAGIGGAIFFGSQWVVLDPIAAVIVSLLIFKIAITIIKEAILELIETSLPKKTENEILEIARTVEGVYNPHDLKTRKIGSNIAIDLHIKVKKHLNITEAHDITVCLEKQLRIKYGQETHISVHTEPLA